MIKFHTSLVFAGGRKASNRRRKILKLLLFDSPSSELLFENQEHGKVPEIKMKLSIPVRGVAAAGIEDSPANPVSLFLLRFFFSRAPLFKLESQGGREGREEATAKNLSPCHLRRMKKKSGWPVHSIRVENDPSGSEFFLLPPLFPNLPSFSPFNLFNRPF